MARERRLDQRQPRTRAVDQAHHGRGNAADILAREADHEVVRQCGQRMDQRLAGMAACIETELGHQLCKVCAQARDFGGRRCQCGAGPDPRVNRDRGNLAAFLDRDEKQVERDSAVDVRQDIRLDDQWHPALAQLWVVEPRKGAVERGIGQHLFRALATNAELPALRAIAVPHQVAQLGQHAAFEPVEQCGSLVVPDPCGVLAHSLAHCGPIGH